MTLPEEPPPDSGIPEDHLLYFLRHTPEPLFALLDAALDALPFEQKTAFVLAEIDGLPLAEVGRIEGVPVGTVKSRVSRARDKLRTILRHAKEPL